MIIKYVGSKWRLAPWIISHFPNHRVFVDVFGGSGAIILRKPKSYIEVYNDINSDLVNLFEIIRTRTKEFLEKLEFLLYSRELYEKWKEEWKNNIKPKDPLECALRFFLLMNGHFSGKWLGSFSYMRARPPEFANRHEKIKFFARRFKSVIIENLDYKELIPKYDSPSTLFYCDPPYVIQNNLKDYYESGDAWDLREHEKLSKVLNSVEGYVCLSYYWFPQLQEWYLDKGWYIRKKSVIVSVKGITKIDPSPRPIKEELLLMNFDPDKVNKFVKSRIKILFRIEV